MPHKTAVIPFLDALDPEAQKIGAVNTICFQGKKLIGYNTDGTSACKLLEPLRGKRVALIGAGGAARAILYELIQRGAHPILFNRTRKTAEELADFFGCQTGDFELLYDHTFDLLISTVPALPLDLQKILYPPIVMDIAVADQETPLLQIARRRGSKCFDFKEMFYNQAKLQQSLWH